MNNKFLAFLVGLAISAVLSFIGGDLIPWGAGGLGILVGLNVVRGEAARTGLRGFLLAAVGLAVAFFLIEHQYYNPDWLTRTVLFCRVFVSHALLIPTLFEARERLNALWDRP